MYQLSDQDLLAILQSFCEIYPVYITISKKPSCCFNGVLHASALFKFVNSRMGDTASG